jgi:hypothetical protein
VGYLTPSNKYLAPLGNEEIRDQLGVYHYLKKGCFMEFFLKGPAACAREAPQPWGLLCNPVMKMICFFRFSL